MEKNRKQNSVSVLLIVLLLIFLAAILAGLLLPSLAKAKAKAQRISSSLRLDTLDDEASQGAVLPEFNTESYARIVDNPFLAVSENPLSTFSVDVDTASYSIMRRFINNRLLPPRDAVRIEEMINYFPYGYGQPMGEHPFSAGIEIAGCPWNDEHRLVRVGLKGREIAPDKRPAANLVFLIDVSGSMEPANKLPLIQSALAELVEKLTADDRVTIVVYAGSSGLVLPPTAGDQKKTILRAIRSLGAGGSTNGGQGIEQAYRSAVEGYIKGGVNRVILCTDGDFNVGVTSPGELVRLIEAQAKSGVFLTVLGFGMGNYKDSTVEQLADKGNGNYAYIDTLGEARKVLVKQFSSTLITIAKDVKIQIEFNPIHVASWRLIGYENRILRKEDFNDDKKDAGEIGAGHTVTALYEIVPAGSSVPIAAVDPLRFQSHPSPNAAARGGELLNLKLRYKAPDSEVSKLMEQPAMDSGATFNSASVDFKFASAVAAFGMLLRDSEHKGRIGFDLVEQLADAGKGVDEEGYRSEFIELIRRARSLPQAR